MNWKFIVVAVLLLFLVIFTVQNYEVVEIKFLLWSFRTSRAILIFVTLFIGIAIGWFSALIREKKEVHKKA